MATKQENLQCDVGNYRVKGFTLVNKRHIFVPVCEVWSVVQTNPAFSPTQKKNGY